MLSESQWAWGTGARLNAAIRGADRGAYLAGSAAKSAASGAADEGGVAVSSNGTA
jgi:hypothetical protein